ncbi:baculoviral IAP repeat-containing protein 3-like isoform X1 [Mya arenaria]|uniref:baculoviral IAP repeat-containing protein 3-like isoform X1 n=1 Tax=Mya arenaria TaxID=6604 RepID=UPI0022E31CA0|nr:baculoviral IAP repeat-containing protein 3-like isoform X1 [Mya arenaria]
MELHTNSLRKYIGELVVNDRENHNVYDHEWARLRSFEKFPRTSLSAIRLSQKGFYYTGVGTEAQCFSCGFSNSKWPAGISIEDIHRKGSPDCPFIMGAASSNVPIHGGADSKPEGENCSSTDSRTSFVNNHNNSAAGHHLPNSNARFGQYDSSMETDCPSIQERRSSKNHTARDTNTTDSFYEVEKALQNENEELRRQVSCKICLDLDASVVFLPCGHMVTCEECAPAMRKCPICRSNIRGTVKAFLP